MDPSPLRLAFLPATSIPIRADDLLHRCLRRHACLAPSPPLPAFALALTLTLALAPRHRPLRALPPCRGVRAAPLLRSRGAFTLSRGAFTLSRGASVVCGAQGQDTAIQVPDVTKSTWRSLVLDSELPVLVEFWASWCGPCKMIDPVIGKLSKEYEGKLKCYKLNTDENPDIATQFGIRSIPTMLIFRNGEKKDSVIGAVPESTLVTCIEKFVQR